jgi:hypothetical protein
MHKVRVGSVPELRTVLLGGVLERWARPHLPARDRMSRRGSVVQLRRGVLLGRVRSGRRGRLRATLREHFVLRGHVALRVVRRLLREPLHGRPLRSAHATSTLQARRRAMQRKRRLLREGVHPGDRRPDAMRAPSRMQSRRRVVPERLDLLLRALRERRRGRRPMRAAPNVRHQRPRAMHRAGGRHVRLEQRLLLEDLPHGDESVRPHRRMHPGVRALLLGWCVLLGKLLRGSRWREGVSASGRTGVWRRRRDLRRKWGLLSRQHVHAHASADGTETVRVSGRRRVPHRRSLMRPRRSVLRRFDERLLPADERRLARMRVFMRGRWLAVHATFGLLWKLHQHVELSEPRWRPGVRSHRVVERSSSRWSWVRSSPMRSHSSEKRPRHEPDRTARGTYPS